MKKLLSVLIISSVLLVACATQKPEKDRFIDATVEVTCMVFEAIGGGTEIKDSELEQNTKDIFSKHGFDVENEAAMEEIAGRYENDPDLEAAVTKALEGCAGDFLDAFGDLDVDLKSEEAMEDTGKAMDAGAVDAGAVDAGAVDAGAVDAGTVDAGTVDAGAVDAGAVE